MRCHNKIQLLSVMNEQKRACLAGMKGQVDSGARREHWDT